MNILSMISRIYVFNMNFERENADRSNTNMTEFQGRGGCPCTDEKHFPELDSYDRRCEFELQLGMFSDRCSFRFHTLDCGSRV